MSAAAAPARRRCPGSRTLRSLGKWLVTFALVVVVVAALYPQLFTVVNSLKSRTAYAQNPLSLPAAISFDDYIDTFNHMQVPRPLFNTIITTAGGLLLSTVAALFIAYAVTKLRIPGGNLVFLFIISMLVIPSQAVSYSLYETILSLGLGGTYQGLILSYAAFGLPMSTYQLVACFRAIPDELIEAARVDGAGDMRILFQMLLALVIMSGSDKTTLMVGVAQLSGQYDVSIPLISAGLVVALLPVKIVYLVFQRQMLNGAIAGAVK